MKKTKKLMVLAASLLLASCSNITPEQITSIGEILKTSSSPSVNISPSPIKTVQKINLDGTIYDSSKVRVSGVTVKVNGQAAVTDSTGHYFLSDLLLGNASITISRDGFNDYVEQQELKDKSQTINFTVSFTSKPQIAINGQAFLPITAPSPTNLKTSFEVYPREQVTNKPQPTPTPTPTITPTPVSTATPIILNTPVPTATPKIISDQDKKQQTYNSFINRKTEVKPTLGQGFFDDNQYQHDSNVDTALIGIKNKYNQGSISTAEYYKQIQDLDIKNGIYYDVEKQKYAMSDQTSKNNIDIKLFAIFDDYSFYYSLQNF